MATSQPEHITCICTDHCDTGTGAPAHPDSCDTDAPCTATQTTDCEPNTSTQPISHSLQECFDSDHPHHLYMVCIHASNWPDDSCPIDSPDADTFDGDNDEDCPQRRPEAHFIHWQAANSDGSLVRKHPDGTYQSVCGAWAADATGDLDTATCPTCHESRATVSR